MENLFMCLTGIIEMLSIVIFLKAMNGKLRIKKWQSAVAIICGGVVLTFLSYAFLSSIAVYKLLYFVLCIVIIFALSLSFESSLMMKLLSAVSFEILSIISSYIFSLIFAFTNKAAFKLANSTTNSIILKSGTEIMLLIFSLVVFMIRDLSKQSYHIEYNLILLTTPVITIIIYAFMPLDNVFIMTKTKFFTLLFISLAVLNIVNTVLTIESIRTMRIKSEKQNLEKELSYQAQKYEFLSTSYRNNRKIIHDVKKHYFAIDEYIKNGKINELSSYVKEAASGLEENFIKYNTGNLVIDSLLSNLDLIAEKNNIKLDVQLNVDSNIIPVTDYDLSIILGNLIDNAITAAENCHHGKSFIQIEIETKGETKFQIHAKNSYEPAASENFNSLEHGYGLQNIHHCLEKYYGLMNVNRGEVFAIDIEVPIIKKDARTDNSF